MNIEQQQTHLHVRLCMREFGGVANRNVVCTARNMVTPQHLAIDEYKWHNEIAKWSGSGKENILSNRRIVFAVILINKNSLRACCLRNVVPSKRQQ